MVQQSDKANVQMPEILERLQQIERVIAEPSNGRRAPEEQATAKHYCSQPVIQPRVLDPSLSPERARLIQILSKKWVNGTKLRYWFFTRGEFAGTQSDKDLRYGGTLM